MKLDSLSVVLLLTYLALGHTSTHSLRRLQRTSPRSLTDENKASSSLPPPSTSPSPPSLTNNNTASLCYQFDLPAIAAQFSQECSSGFSNLNVATVESEEDKRTIELVCKSDCMGRVIKFFKDVCKNERISQSLLGLCVISETPEKTPCPILSSAYNWTKHDASCTLDPLTECSPECSVAVTDALLNLGCCSNYFHRLSLSVTDCGVQMPRHCPYPFKHDKEDGGEEKEKEKEKEEGGEEEEEDELAGEEAVATESGNTFARPFTYLVLSLSTLSLVVSS